MTKRKLKKKMTKRKFNTKKTKKYIKHRLTKKTKYGGDDGEKSIVSLVQERKDKFRSDLNKYVKYIVDAKSRNQVKDAVRSIIDLFTNNVMINTLIPVSSNGKYLSKDKQTPTEKIVDMVSPVVFLFDNLTGVDLLQEKEFIRILDVYFVNGGNFNRLSSRFKVSPFKNELNKGRVNNIRILLDKSNKFYILEDGLDDVSREQLSELIPNEQQINNNLEPQINKPKLEYSYRLPDNNDIGYDKSTAPEFWKPIFQEGEELIRLREIFISIYQEDRYTDDNQKRFKICDLVEKIIPAYVTKYSLQYRETVKTLVNVNILNCFITLLYSIILYKLADTEQDYLFMFKGGRALQLSLVDMPDVGTYFSEDTDILVIPNKKTNSVYNLELMRNLSGHIAYLVKWFIPEEINVIVSLSSNPKNTNKDIIKLVYNDGKIFKALSDIGFGEIHEDIKKYFDNLSYSRFYLDIFETNILFITPTIEDMLSEKLFYYAKYLTIKNDLADKLKEMKLSNIEVDPELYNDFLDKDRLTIKFKLAIIKLVQAITNKNYTGTEDFDRKEAATLIIQDVLGNFEDYSPEQRRVIMSTILPSIK